MKSIVFIACAFLVAAGIFLVVESKNNYKESVKQYDSLSGKFFDTSFKKPFTLTSPAYSIVREGYSQALSYFMLALGLLLFVMLLPRLQNFSISPTGVNIALKDIQQTFDTLITQTNTIQSASVGEGGKTTGKPNMELAAKTSEKTEHPDDPQKGKWGEKAERNFRKISASVTESSLSGIYVVLIRVESTNSDFPLKGAVKFHLHDTFLNADPVIAVKNGEAVLKLTKVWGAFTVGAEADDGKTKLELDLSELEGAPEIFKTR
jgi:hypothetical protein